MSKYRTAGWLATAALLGAALITPAAALAVDIHQDLPITASEFGQDCSGAPVLEAGEVYWHFVAQGATIDSTMTATFAEAGSKSDVPAYASNGNATHFGIVTNTGSDEQLTAAAADPASQLQLSHVCVGADPSPTPSIEVTPSPSIEVTPTPSIEVTPSPSLPIESIVPTPSLPIESIVPTPSGSVLGETGSPEITPPSTDGLAGAGSSTTGSGWPMVLLALGAVLAAALLLTPARKRR